MKIALIILLVAVAANAAQLGQRQDQDVVIVRDDREGPVEAIFSHTLELSDGTFIEESGAPGAAGQSNKQGSYSYTAPDGTLIEITWVANEGGFQPRGSHLPVGPDIPEHVHELLRIAEQQRAEGIEFDEQGFRI